jgi:ClpP class serine protease
MAAFCMIYKSPICNRGKKIDKNELDYYQFTAGKYKRTVTLFDKVTQEHKDKLQAELEEIHVAFIQHIKSFRKSLDVVKVATGEVWLGSHAKQRGLVDELMTSDEFITSKFQSHIVLKVRKAKRKDKWSKYMKMFSVASVSSKILSIVGQFASFIGGSLGSVAKVSQESVSNFSPIADHKKQLDYLQLCSASAQGISALQQRHHSVMAVMAMNNPAQFSMCGVRSSLGPVPHYQSNNESIDDADCDSD